MDSDVTWFFLRMVFCMQSKGRRMIRRTINVMSVLSLNLILFGSADGTSTTPPSIQGSWTIVYNFVEMKGDRGQPNACQGPYPWQYTWQFDLCQGTDSTGAPSLSFIALISGTTYQRSYTFALSTSQLVQTNCQEQYNYVNEAPVTIQAAAWGFPSKWEIMK